MVVNEITLVNIINKKAWAKFTFTNSIIPTVAKKGGCKPWMVKYHTLGFESSFQQ